MAINTTNTVNSLVGDGVTTAIPVTYVFFGTDELEVIERDIATGAETVKTLTTHYTVSGGNGATGTVTALAAPAPGKAWYARRKTKRLQATSYGEGDPFAAKTHERALDRGVAISQEIEEQIGRSLKFPKTDAAPPSLPSIEQMKGKFFYMTAGGEIVGLGLGDIGATPLPLGVDQGGTGATDAAAARTALGVVAATLMAAGLIELATQGEVNAGTDTVRALTPETLAAWAPADATVDILNDKVLFRDATDGKIKKGAFPAAGITIGTMVTPGAVTSIDFTGIPAGTKRITVAFAGLSRSGSARTTIQLGDSGGIETTGYNGASWSGSNGAYSNGFDLQDGNANATSHGSMIFTLMDPATNLWACQGVVGRADAAFCTTTAGTKALSATLDRLRITTSNGTDTFDAGSVNIAYE